MPKTFEPKCYTFQILFIKFALTISQNIVIIDTQRHTGSLPESHHAKFAIGNR